MFRVVPAHSVGRFGIDPFVLLILVDHHLHRILRLYLKIRCAMFNESSFLLLLVCSSLTQKIKPATT